nr:hypothetical protein [Planctomycetota bacterium]
MKNVAACVLVIALIAGYAQIEPLSAAATPDVDIWTAAARGNIEAIKQHLEAGTDVDAKQPPGGG